MHAYRSSTHACKACASKIHDFLLHVQLGPWCKKRPLLFFAVSTQSSNPFLKHAFFSNNRDSSKAIKISEEHVEKTQMRHCDVLAVLDANQSFLSCYPHLQGLWKAHLWLKACLGFML